MLELVIELSYSGLIHHVHVRSLYELNGPISHNYELSWNPTECDLIMHHSGEYHRVWPSYASP